MYSNSAACMILRCVIRAFLFRRFVTQLGFVFANELEVESLLLSLCVDFNYACLKIKVKI